METRALPGLLIATIGVMILTPDTLLMRLSGMDGAQMLAWRGTLSGLSLLLAWAVFHRKGLAALASGPGLTVILCQCGNAMCFTFGIAVAPVAVVLLGVAAVPVLTAIFARVLLGEATAPATWVTIAAVLAGIALAVLGDAEGIALSPGALWGALAGLGTATSLALSFVLLRAHPGVPILPAIGTGYLIVGVGAALITGPAALGDGAVLPIAVTGAVILPASFFLLSLAARHTPAANVSLLLLLETILGPLWVWFGIGEAPTPMMLFGGAVVVGSLSLYLARQASLRG